MPPGGGSRGPVAHIDLTSRRLELQIVIWGAPGSGTSTTLRFLHGACPAHARGELASLEHTGANRVVCDYAPLDLPRWGGQGLRAHVYTMGAGQGLRGAQRRILAGADAVIFMADARRGALPHNAGAWHELEEALGALEERGAHLPIHVAANFSDDAESLGVEEVARFVGREAPGRSVLGVTATRAPVGLGVPDCFTSVVSAAASVAVPAPEGEAATRRAAFAAALAEQLGGTGERPVTPTPGHQSRRVQLPSAQGLSDGAGLHMALDVSRWLALRELDVRRLQRERALGGLLLTVGQTCLAATDVEGLARRVLGALAMNLDAVSGWLGLPEGGGLMRVYDPMGAATDGSAFAETSEALGMGVGDGGVAAVGPETGSLLPGGAVGGRGLFAPFPVGDGRRGWLLLVGPPDRGLPEDAEAVLATAGAFVGLTLARLRALQRLRESNAALEGRVEARTEELRREKEGLEQRVRERTAELEQAKRSTLEAERRLLDRERTEGIHRLAAGLAHELNNPIGAALADLDFTIEGLERLAASVAGLVGAELEDLLSAGRDARHELRRVASSVATLFGQAADSRRDVTRTALTVTVKEAVQAFCAGSPGAPPPRVQIEDPVACGVPPVECSRWVFRLLTGLVGAEAPAQRIEIGRSPDGPRLRLWLQRLTPAVTEVAAGLRREVERSGSRLEIVSDDAGSRLDVILPPALGESCMYARTAAEALR